MTDNGRSLVITEKPSVARDIARALDVRGRGTGWLGNDTFRITWCLGHLLELADPASYASEWQGWRLDTLPMLPDTFRLQPRKSSMDQWKTVRTLLKDSSLARIVNACDAGREGELIFAWAYEVSGAKAPVERLWISSMTRDAIRKGFDRLRAPAELEGLESAARCRAEADWMVGLNATRAMTLQARGKRRDGPLLSVGRVQTPTLALIAAREDVIGAFQPRDFWQIRVTFTLRSGEEVPSEHVGASWTASWTGEAVIPEGLPDSQRGKDKDRIWDAATARTIADRVSGRAGEVTEVANREVTERAPLLYDLTTLQKEANARWRYTATQTLELAQSLYERHKVTTYPRTDSRHLGQDQVPGLASLVRSLTFGPYAAAAEEILEAWPPKIGKRVVDDTEVSDHHAIIPTGQDPRSLGLSVEEKRIFDLISRRFLAVFMPVARFATSRVVTTITHDAGSETFLARGRTCLDPGWQRIDPPRKKRKEELLPPLQVGFLGDQKELDLHQGQTRPPKRYTEATLLTAMERAGDNVEEEELRRAMKRNGLGTPATRAAIIETLLTRGYIERRARDLHPTLRGRTLIRTLPVEGLRSPQLTGAWEARLVAMTEGRDTRTAFMADLRSYTQEIVDAIRGADMSEARADLTPAGPREVGAILGKCPQCGNDVGKSHRGWLCTDCEFYIPGKVARREVSKRMASQLLTTGKTAAVKGFKNRAGKEFTAALVLDDAGDVTFGFEPSPQLGACPACTAPVRQRGKIVTCDTGRDCPFVVFEDMSGAKIPVSAVRTLLESGTSDMLHDFRTRDGTRYSGVLVWKSDRVQVQKMDPRSGSTSPGACPKCGQRISFDEPTWKCTGCPYTIPGEIAGRAMDAEDIQSLLEHGRTPRLHGFRQSSGARFKASCIFEPNHTIRLEFRGTPEDIQPARKPGDLPHAFEKRADCPACVTKELRSPGYVIAGRTAWGCSRWKAGCKLRVPFQIGGLRLQEDQIRRFFKRERATLYLKGFTTEDGRPRNTCRVAFTPDPPHWTLEERGGKKRST